MPSIRKRLKKLTSSKKSKSTSDLDQMKQEGSTEAVNKHQEEDSRSYISEAISERTDVSAYENESTYSYASASGEKKKKRKFKLKLSSKKKKGKLLKDPEGNVIVRTLSIEHDPRGPGLHNMEDGDSLKPESVELSRSVGSNIGRDECENSEADEWRMSGLLENVDRTSNQSLPSGKDNLISTFESRRKTLQKPEFESTPKKIQDQEEEEERILQAEKGESDDAKITVTKPGTIIEVKFSNKGSEKQEEVDGEKLEAHENLSDEEESLGDIDEAEELEALKRDLEPVEEEDLVQIVQTDPECEVVIEDEHEEEAPIQVVEQNSIVCDVGKGKKVIIRHLEEVATNANLEMSLNVSMEDWLVLNIEKDDWVVVGYDKVGNDVGRLYEQSVDTV